MLLTMVQLRSVAAFLSFDKPGAVKLKLVERIVAHLLRANGAEDVPAAVVPAAVVPVADVVEDVVEDGFVSEEDVVEEQECGDEDDGFVSEEDDIQDFTSDEDDEDES